MDNRYIKGEEMNAQAHTQAQLTKSSFTSAPTSLVQRKCACGGSAGLSGECEECQKGKLTGESASLIQPKLKISEPNDKYEQEADQVADEVMRVPTSTLQRKTANQDEEAREMLLLKPLSAQVTPLIQRESVAEEQDEEEETRQPKVSRMQKPAVTHEIESDIQDVRQRDGQPLDLATRVLMESRFGHDFRQVRVHNTSQAATAARAVNARAFTVGRDVVFGSGQYSPGTEEGQCALE